MKTITNVIWIVGIAVLLILAFVPDSTKASVIVCELLFVILYLSESIRATILEHRLKKMEIAYEFEREFNMTVQKEIRDALVTCRTNSPETTDGGTAAGSGPG